MPRSYKKNITIHCTDGDITLDDQSNQKLIEAISTIIYKPVSNIDRFKSYANEILGGYGEMSDSDIKRDIEEVYIDGELKGYIGLSKYNEEDGTKLLGIGNFMIIERGKGYGTQVIKDIVSKYKGEYDLIYCFVDSDNKGAISLYKKLGKVYDEDGPNDNGQYYVTFYDNGKYKLEETIKKNALTK
jgi:RimJ/RimL family protein N-acetyltransferase